MAPKNQRPARRKLLIAVATTDWSRSYNDPSGGMALGGAGWIRFGQLRKYSRNRIVIGSLIRSGKRLGVVGWDNVSTVTPDVLFIQRHMEKWVPDGIRDAVAHGQIVVNDVDDWYWNLHPENNASKNVDPANNRKFNTDHYAQACAESTLVTVSTPFLADKFNEQGIRTHIIENGVDTSMFSIHRQNRNVPLIGWAGSTAHRSGDLEIIKEFAPLVPLHRWHHLGHHGGHPSFHQRTGIPENKVTTTPMLPPWEYATAFDFDIGTVPLSDHEFNHAKSWIKGLEYVAAGIPFIASPSPEYLRLNREHGVGRIAHTPEEWAQHVKELADAKQREKEAQEAYRVVSTTLDARNQAKALDDFVDQVLS